MWYKLGFPVAMQAMAHFGGVLYVMRFYFRGYIKRHFHIDYWRDWMSKYRILSHEHPPNIIKTHLNPISIWKDRCLAILNFIGLRSWRHVPCLCIENTLGNPEVRSGFVKRPPTCKLILLGKTFSLDFPFHLNISVLPFCFFQLLQMLTSHLHIFFDSWIRCLLPRPKPHRSWRASLGPPAATCGTFGTTKDMNISMRFYIDACHMAFRPSNSLGHISCGEIRWLEFIRL